MITVYDGLWYLTNDVGYEVKIILFIVILFVNALFGIIWIKAYLIHAEWAVDILKKYRLESQYIKSEEFLPYFPERIAELVPFDKIQFLCDMLRGHQFYTDDITHQKMHELMKNR